MELDDGTSLRIRIAVLETELSHSLADKASALASAQQTISTLTSIINSQIQSQSHSKSQLQENDDRGIFTPKITELQNDNLQPIVTPGRAERKDTDVEILQLREQILGAKLDAKRLRDAFRVEVNGKETKIAERYLGNNGYCNGRDSFNLIPVQQAGRDLESAAELPRNLIDIDSPDNKIVSTNQVPEAEDECEEDDVDFDFLENRELDDFEAIDDLLGPEPGMTLQHMKLREQAIDSPPESSSVEYGIRSEREELDFPTNYGSGTRRGLERWRSWELDYRTRTNLDRDSDFARFVGLELQYGEAPISTEAAKLEDIHTVEIRVGRNEVAGEKIDGEKLDEKETNKKTENSRKPDGTCPVSPSETIREVATEEKSSAVEKSDCRPYPASILRSRGRNRHHNRDVYKNIPSRYKDVDRAPLPRTGATIPRRQRVLDAYDFTPGDVPDFNSSVIPSIISTTAQGSRSSIFKETYSISEEPYFDASLWKSPLEREDAIARHKADCTSDEGRFPGFFHYGISFRPRDNKVSYLRTVHIGNLPIDISMCSMLARVRGGDVLHAVICNTISITGSLSALVVFKKPDAAAAYVKFANTNGISFSETQKQRPIFTLLNTPSWPAKTTVAYYGQTRVLVIQNELIASMKVELKVDLCISKDDLVEICDRPDGWLEIQFSGERAAGRAYSRLTRWRKFARLRVEFVADPCSRPLSDLLAPAGPCIPPTSVPKIFNSDEIDADDDLDDGEIVANKEKHNFEREEDENITVMSLNTGLSSLSWADEMNDIATSTNSAINLSVYTQELQQTHPQVVIEKQEPKRRPKGLAGSKYATLVPGY